MRYSFPPSPKYLEWSDSISPAILPTSQVKSAIKLAHRLEQTQQSPANVEYSCGQNYLGHEFSFLAILGSAVSIGSLCCVLVG